MSGWSEEEDELLRCLVAEGLTSTEIGARLQRSRSSVMGRVFRNGLKLSGNMKEAAAREKEREIANSTPNRALHSVVLAQARAQGRLPPHTLTDEPHRERKRKISFEELRHNSCRWPLGHVGKPDFGFCGAARMNEMSPYCCAHHRKAYQERTADGRRIKR